MIAIHPIQTGSVRIKTAQRQRRKGGLVRVLLDSSWTEWLPIYAWVIEHPEGVFVVDTGDTARTLEPDYFPWWHPYYRTSVQMKISPEQEIGPQLHGMGIDPLRVRQVVLTHFHTDHAGGLSHFPGVEILVEERDLKSAQGLRGKLQGYLPHRWPTWFNPTPIPFAATHVGPFAESYSITAADDVILVRTPGHTPGHVSVIVKTDGLDYFLAGDTSYTQDLLLERRPDGVSPSRAIAIQTMDAILSYARTKPMIYLPTHDPRSVERLRHNQCLQPV